MSVILDFSQFDAVLRAYVARCPHTLDAIVNKKMYYILRAAWEGTPKAERSTIEQALNVVAYKISRSRKTGKSKRGTAMVGKGSRVYALVNARRRKAGLKGLHGKDMEKAARKLVGARLRASGTLRRGWLLALRTFSAAAKESMVNAQDGRQPTGRGRASAAQPGWDPSASSVYEVNIESRHEARIDPRVEAAVADAFEREQASMKEYIERKIQEEIQRAGAGP
jgi:hypothetical protein